MGDKYNSQQNQVQSLKQNEKQEEALIKYYIYQDLQNLINLVYSRKAVLEHFQNSPNNPIVILSNNKIILQLNLSSGIHKDLVQQYSKNTYLSSILKKERDNAVLTLKNVAQLFQSKVGTQNQNQELMKDPIENYLKQFILNYESGLFKLNQFQLQDTNRETQFNEQVLSKVISSMQTVDGQINQVSKNSNYQKPTNEQLMQRAEEYYNMTKDKLNQVHPQNNQTQFNNNQEKNTQNTRVYLGNNIGNQEQLTSSNSEQEYFNNKQERIPQGNKLNYINNIIENQEQQTSSNSEQEQNFAKPNTNIEKEKLIRFVSSLEFSQTGTQPQFKKQVEDLYTQANNIQKDNKQLSYPETLFAKKLSQQNDVLQFLIRLHYYFQLFVDYCYNKRPGQHLQSLQEFAFNNRIIGKIDLYFFQYLVKQKDLIERNLSSKTQMNNNIETISSINSPQAQNDIIEANQTISEEDYVWLMYTGFCDYYTIQKN